jgi:hypothetical protein
VRSTIPKRGAERTLRNISGGIAPVVKVVLLDEAPRRFEAEDEWWRAHRDAKDLFVEDLAQTLEQPRSMPGGRLGNSPPPRGVAP